MKRGKLRDLLVMALAMVPIPFQAQEKVEACVEADIVSGLSL